MHFFGGWEGASLTRAMVPGMVGRDWGGPWEGKGGGAPGRGGGHSTFEWLHMGRDSQWLRFATAESGEPSSSSRSFRGDSLAQVDQPT